MFVSVLDPPGAMAWRDGNGDVVDLHSLLMRLYHLVRMECESPTELCSTFSCLPMPKMPSEAVSVDGGHLNTICFNDLANDWSNVITKVRSDVERDYSFMIYGCGGIPRRFASNCEIMEPRYPVEQHDHSGKLCYGSNLPLEDLGIFDHFGQISSVIWMPEVCISR